MLKLTLAAVALAGTLVAASGVDDGPPRPQPLKEHAWLQKMVGEWTVEGEAHFDPAAPAAKIQGIETGRRIGGFWATSEYRGELMGAPFTGVLTLGFDAERKKYVATWIDSMQGHLWQYQGTLDAAGKTLTLEGEGPCCENPGTTVKVRDILEFQDENRRTFTTKVEKDGEWVTAMTLRYRRK